MRIEPEALVRRLFKLQTNPGMNGFVEIAQAYSDLLCEGGLNFYQQLIESEWDRLRSCEETGSSEEKRRFERLTELMEDSAKRRGGLESLIETKSHCLNDAEDYLELARLCKRSGEDGLAM